MSVWADGWALVAASLATVRVCLLARRLAVPELAARLRTGRRFPTWLRDREAYRRAVERLLPYAPPRRMGTCLRRSLILLDLWSRCGLEPRLHLGANAVDGKVLGGHAWITVGGEPSDPGAGLHEVCEL